MANKVNSTNNNLFFSIIFRISFEVFLDICFASVYNLYTTPWISFLDLYSNIVSIIFLTIFSFLLIITSFLPCFKIEKLTSLNALLVDIKPKGL
mmetsp:Transcript_1619/g.1437  ORF Transcript_1619/g.1437 Transcript_1619/m.1437 type:complete len:94 (+) Transcript_1619:1095-1376(+)